MAVTIRLARHGAKKNPIYRIVVADRRFPRDGRRLEQVGTYDPSHKPVKILFNEAKLADWLRRGARPSQTVAQLMKQSGLPRAATAEAPETTS
jgi:small subunit ribosomal protein S16